jgi:hydrogenase maturation protein HypF
MNLPLSTLNLRRVRVEIHGAVQGVGFRPFVYRLATELGLAGWVINDTQGVFIEVEGPETAVQRFLARLPAEVPPRAIVQTIESAWLTPAGDERFEIRHSDHSGAKTVLVLPDIATCPDCLAEVLDPANRRHRYPFTNCTNCGPRFTIIEALPYDRPNTTMRRFTLCPDCKTEYENPLDRRFHAQPNACPVCGPRLALYDDRRQTADGGPQMADDGPTADGGQRSSGVSDQSSVDEVQDLTFKVQGSAVGDVQPATFNLQPPAVGGRRSAVATGDAALKRAAAALRAGQIVAVKGLGGFHLMADAGSDEAVRRLHESKPRRAKPFALMARDLDQVRELCEVPPAAEALLTSPEAPIVLLEKRSSVDDVQRSTFNVQRSAVSHEVAPDNPYLGVMLPYTPLHHLLLREVGRPVVATSGNLSDEPICTDETDAMQRLGHIADVFLVHDRPIARHVDDSVAWIVRGAPRLLRRARGYAPLPVTLKTEIPTILAVGAHLKNTVALSVGRQVFISQHIGDLETPEALAAFERVIADFLKLYEAQPVAIAHDLHPDYASTRYTLERSNVQLANVKTLIAVQHHHAHLAACLAENGVEGPALGVTWDGTGYGADGTIWGGEFLLGDAAGFERVAHLRPFRLPGGDAAVKEPRRVALALLWEAYGDAALEMDDLAPIRSLPAGERRVLAQMLRKGLNAPITTSAGRLFDGIAALIGLHQEVSFEGQAAMALEYAADAAERGAYPVELVAGSRLKVEGAPPSTFDLQPSTLDWRPLLDALLADLRRGVPAGIIAARFHNALVEAMAAVAQAIGQPRLGVQPKVALTGGCFQNRLLTERTADHLESLGFEVLLHRQVPPNDGCISLGQVAVATTQLAQSAHIA